MVTTALQATPRPWTTMKAADGFHVASSASQLMVAKLYGQETPAEIEANAELIVRAVNNLDSLVAALEAVISLARHPETRLVNEVLNPSWSKSAFETSFQILTQAEKVLTAAQGRPLNG